MKNACALILTLAGAMGLACVVGCQGTVDARSQKPPSREVRVEVLTATKTNMSRTTTQPATVHGFYEARLFARAAGYLMALNVDIGDAVKAGDVLAVIGVPEMDRQHEAKLALIRQLEADERRAVSQWAVAKASMVSYQAKLDQAKAEVGKADAFWAAARVELQRVADLVEQRAVADRLLDEAQKKHDAAIAEKAAAEAAVTSSEAELTLAAAQADAAQADVDVAKATTDVARRELEELLEMINYAKITAPFEGIVSQRNIDPGDLVRNTENGSSEDKPPLFVITQIDKVRIRVPVPERDSPLATVGDAATITLQALPGQVFDASISRVAGVLDEQTRTMLVEVDLPNPEGMLRHGMFGQATITLAPPDDTLTLPASAVRYDEQGASYVYVVNAADEVEVTAVETGLDDGQHIEITGGLSGNDRIVGPLLRRLKAGQKVLVEG